MSPDGRNLYVAAFSTNLGEGGIAILRRHQGRAHPLCQLARRLPRWDGGLYGFIRPRILDRTRQGNPGERQETIDRPSGS